MLVFNRPRLMFEAPGDFAAAPADPAAGDPDPGEPGWQGPSQEEWEQTQAQLAQIAEFASGLQQQYQPPPPQPTGPSVPDPFADDYADQLEAWFQAKVAPYEQFQQGLQQQEGTERALDILADLAARDGEFDRDTAFLRAQQLVQSGQVQDGEKALERAAKEQRDHEARIAQAAIDRHTNQLRTLSGAPQQPGSSYAQGSQVRTVPDYRQEGGSVTDRIFGDAA